MAVLELNHVSKMFGSKPAVNAIDFSVGEGEIYGLLGANGAGKTTTMRMVLGIIYPDSGSILRKGIQATRELNRILGYLPEERGLYPKIKVCDQIPYLAELRGMKRKDADRALKQWLERFAVPEYYSKKVEELSKGNQQKIQFIAAVIHNPDILILDEAFSGLDPVNVELLKESVKQLRDEGKTILFSSHRMEHVEELCDEITILHRSNTVAQGNIRDMKNNYPKEKVMLEVKTPVTGIENITGVQSVKTLGQHAYEIKMNDPNAAQAILKSAAQQSEVNRFQVMEPTLNEIFIQVAGDQHE